MDSTPQPLRDAHSTPLPDLADELSSNLERGLDPAQIPDLQKKHGPNQLQEAPRSPIWKRFLRQFKELVIWILIVAALISGFAGETVDAVAILAIVLLNGIIGFVQEERAEHSLAALRKMSSPTAKVIRGGQLQSVPAAELVPGDRVELESGDNIPADVRLIEAYGLLVQEAALTGESAPVEKQVADSLPAEIPLGDRVNMAYMGTVASAGRASAIVTAIGMDTELGRIAGLLSRQPPEPTPLQVRLAELGRVLVYVCLGIVAVVFLLHLLRGEPLMEVFLISVSLAVAAVPEGMPAVVTLALALGLQRMAKRNALIRRLPSVETLGSVTVICSDKTGTLTRNEMTVRRIVVGAESYEVTGSGYAPTGELKKTPAANTELSDDLRLLLTIGARCNHAQVQQNPDDDGRWQATGDPTEAALVVVALKAGIGSPEAGEKLVAEIPFDSQRKTMSVVFEQTDGSRVMYSKGAPENLLPHCAHERMGGKEQPLTDSRRTEILAQNAELAEQALRVLGLAYRRLPAGSDEPYEEKELVFAGLVGMIDPPREEAKQAVKLCRRAGIRPVMITGDHPATAKAIAAELGILDEQGQVVSGQELERTSDDDLAARVTSISVYARVSAEHKLRIVRGWQKQKQVVAMTGDGVNDAPAVKAADIGIAMGMTGTDVTKEASDMVLTDDNFASIISAVEEGRSIFDNIQNFIHYLLSCNAGEVLLMLWSAIVGWPMPLTAIHLLWINLVTDGLPALALAMEPPDRRIMRRPPRPPHEPVFTKRRGALILAHGTLIATAAAFGFWWTYRGESSLDHARLVAFSVMAFSQLCFSFACRSETYTLPQLGFFTNPYLLGAIGLSAILQAAVITVPVLRPVFEVQSDLSQDWLLVLLLALAPVTIVEVTKLVVASLRDVARR